MADRQTSGKKPAKQEPTEYLVQRRPATIVEAMPEMPENTNGLDALRQLWEDVKTVTASGAPQAIRLAVGEGEEARAGEYRAIPTRSDNRIQVEVSTQTVINFGNQNGVAATTTKEPASA